MKDRSSSYIMSENIEEPRPNPSIDLVNSTSYPSTVTSQLNYEYAKDKYLADNNDNSINLIACLLHNYKHENSTYASLPEDFSKHSLLDSQSRLEDGQKRPVKNSSGIGLAFSSHKKLLANTRVNSGIGRDYWLDDASAIKCRACDKKFTTFLRKHHCRICGKIFCSNCTTFVDGSKFNHNGKMRVCLLCNKLADRYEDGYLSSEDEEEEEEEDETTDDDDHKNNDTHILNPQLDSESNVLRRTYNDNCEEFSTGGTSKVPENGKSLNHNASSKNQQAFSLSSPPPMIAIPTTRAGEAVEIDILKSKGLSSSAANFKPFNSHGYIDGLNGNGNNNDNETNSSDDENQMISFMNNHEFNWPKSAESKSNKTSQPISIVSDNNHIYGENSAPHFLAKVNSFKSNATPTLNSLMNHNKTSRRRVFSHRYKNRKESRNFSNNVFRQKSTHIDNGIQFTDDFQKIGESYATCLLNELLVDKKIDRFEDWSSVLINSLKKLNNIEIDLKNTRCDDLSVNDPNYNFSNYIKIKKILGASLHKTKTIEGIVFSKKLPLKTMPTAISNPKIMLITFPIEYDQDINSRHHFQSLESIIAQQDQYIKKLVDRILNLKPNIIVSSNSVNGLALKLFADNGISVAPNNKLNNLIKLSKFTDSTIITSIDILAMKPRLGSCGVFKVLNFKYKNIVRSYLLFDECPNKIGLTIILRDFDDDILTKVKGCLMIMIYTFANIKLESSFMRDQCLKVVDNNELKFTQIGSPQPLYSFNFKTPTDFITLINTRLVSTSPWVKFGRPLILEQLEATKNKIEKNQLDYDIFLSKSAEEKFNSKMSFGIQNLDISDETDLLKLVTAIKEYKENYWNIETIFYLKKWDQFWRSRELTFFDPNYNQNIVILFSMISKKNSTPCVGPEIQLIDFYWENDFSLGQFIENMCLNANNICTQNCELPLKDHYRSYVHDNGKVDIFIESNTMNITSNNIMTWSVCKSCLNSTPVLPLNDTSYKYSFGKFLELIFWFNNSFDVKILGNNTCQCNKDNTDFDFFKDYIHYFSYKNYKIHLEYSKIDILKLIIPKFQLFWNPVYGYKIKQDQLNDVKAKSDNFFNSVYNRLVRIKLDGTNLEVEQIEEGNLKLTELKSKLSFQRQEIELLLTTMYRDMQVNEHTKLNIILREVQELSSFWNFEFQTFAKTFLPSEKDVKKITAFQLDRLFKSLASKDEEESDTEDKAIVGKKNEAIDIKNDDKTYDESISSQEKATIERPPVQLNLSPKKNKSQLILNRIHQLNNQQSDDLFWLPPNKSVDGKLDEGKVKQLTKFFDTQEYFNQRELEKQKIDDFNKYTPKVSSMKPQIEVYKSASDAVNSEASKVTRVNQGHTDGKTDYDESNINHTADSEANKEKKREVEVPEKVSLLKSLTHFWADRSATLWEPLAYPLSSSEHIFVDSDVIVREDEPSSIIAFCLSTNDYESKLANTNITTTAQNHVMTDNESKLEDGAQSKVDEEKGADNEQSAQNCANSNEHKEFEQKKIERDQNLEGILLKKGFHLKYQFEEGYSTILCKIFFTQQFDALRKKCGVSSSYIESLARCVKWDSTGGKSGSAFLKTLDQRFIIKELSKAELDAFVHFAPSYFEYFAHVLFHDLPSVLVKIFGFYQIQVKNTLPNAKSYTMDILIMENLFYDRKIDRIFDLKGSMRNRHVEQTGKENEVLLDENMVEYIYESPLFIKENDKRLLRASLWNDTLFLEKMNVMDYSLVVGIDHAKDELVVGIIDCIRTFTWDKKLESWVKEKGLVGNVGVGKEPTVITPKQYKNRFREAMERYILMTPGVYYQGTTNST